MTSSVKSGLNQSAKHGMMLTALSIGTHVRVIEQLLSWMAPDLKAASVDRVRKAIRIIEQEAGKIEEEAVGRF